MPRTLDCKFELKDMKDTGVFSGYLSYFGNRDSQGDIVQKGAFKQTLSHWKTSGKKVPILYQHDQRRPVGVYDEMREDDKGLYVEGALSLALMPNGNPQVPDAWLAYASMQAGSITGQSIGYDTVKGKVKFEGSDRFLQEVKLYEGSLVTFPANDLCGIDSIKALGEAKWIEALVRAAKSEDFDSLLAGIQTRRESYRLRDDIAGAFDDLFWQTMYSWGDESPADLIAVLDVSMDQLKVAVLAWAACHLKIEDDADDKSHGSWWSRKSAQPFIKDMRSKVEAARDALTALLESDAPLGLDEEPSGGAENEAAEELDLSGIDFHSLVDEMTAGIAEITDTLGGTDDADGSGD